MYCLGAQLLFKSQQLLLKLLKLFVHLGLFRRKRCGHRFFVAQNVAANGFAVELGQLSVQNTL
jgi:hypothetical protein